MYQIDRLQVLCTPGRIDLATCLNVTLFKTIDVGQLWVNHHGRTLLTLPNLAKTTITCPSNLLYHDDVDGEPGGDDSSRDDDDDVKEAPRVHSDRRQAPSSRSSAPPSTADATSSGAKRFSTVLTNYKFRTRRSCTTIRTWPT